MTTSCLQRQNSSSIILNQDGTKRRATKLEMQYILQQQQQYSEPTSSPTVSKPPTTPEKTNRNFVSSTFTKTFLQVSDLVLVLIPEEMQIIDSLDPEYHMQMGCIVKVIGDEALIQLKQTKEVITVPTFCLCLEDQVLYKRIKECRKCGQSPSKSFSATDVFIQNQRIPQL